MVALKKKVTGVTILESVVSMTILLIVIVSVSVIVLNSLKSQNLYAKTSATIIIGNEIARMNKSKHAAVFKRDYKHFFIRSSVTDDNEMDGLFLYTIEAQSMASSRRIYMRRILLPDDEYVVINENERKYGGLSFK